MVTYFFPYLLVYLVAWAFDLPTREIKWIFLALHTVLLSVILYKFSKQHRAQIGLFIAFTIVLLLPGAYLEFPSDPWQHYRGITSWEYHSTVASNDVGHRFGYFFYWTFLHWVPLEGHRIALALISAGAQLLMYVHVFRFCLYLTTDRRLSSLQTFSMLILGGTVLFSFRYYALAPTMLALAAYFASLPLVMEALNRRLKSREWTSLGFLIVFMGFNHFQEVLLLGISTSALILERITRRYSTRLILMGAFGVIAASCVAGFFLLISYPELFQFQDHYRLTRFGTIHLFHPEYQYYQTIGFHGVLGILAALWLLNHSRRLAFLTLIPIAVFMVPWTTMVYSQLLPRGSPGYRLLFAMPTCFALTTGVYALFQRWPSRQILLTTGILILFALPPMRPFYGRLLFQFYKSDPALSLAPQIETAQWIRNRLPDISKTCWILTDDVTDFSINTMLGRKNIGDRLYPVLSNYKINTHFDLLNTLNESKEFCGILLARIEEIPPFSLSWIGQHSKHWEPTSTLPWSVQKGLRPTANFLIKQGYTEISVPPYYSFFSSNSLKKDLPLKWYVLGESNLIFGKNGKIMILNVDKNPDSVHQILSIGSIPAIDSIHFTLTASDFISGTSELYRKGVLLNNVYVRYLDSTNLRNEKRSDYHFDLVSKLVSDSKDFGYSVHHHLKKQNYAHSLGEGVQFEDFHIVLNHSSEKEIENHTPDYDAYTSILSNKRIRIGHFHDADPNAIAYYLYLLQHGLLKSLPVDILILTAHAAKVSSNTLKSISLFSPKVVISHTKLANDLRTGLIKRGVKIYENENWSIEIKENQYEISPIRF